MKKIVIIVLIISAICCAYSKNLLKHKSLTKNKNSLCNYPYPVYFISRSTGYYVGRSSENYGTYGPKAILDYNYDKWGLCGFQDPGSLFNLEINQFLSWQNDENSGEDIFFMADANSNLNQNWGFDYDLTTNFYTIWNNACSNCCLTADTTTKKLSLKPLITGNPEQQWTLFVQKN